jgi:3-keto-disaccharide hydrolase
MRKFLPAAAMTLLLGVVPAISNAQVDTKWKIHDMDRPVPAVVDPGSASTPDAPGHAPSDAVQLFDGKDLSKWAHKDGSPAKWKVENGYAEVAAKTGYIYTRESFGDCQLHVEFSEPVPPKGESQERGNSGIFLMGLYEIQVLDSYENKTYADGQASSVYGQYPPLVNASRPPGQWQTYDIVFHGPRFDASGKLTRPAHVTVLHNGVLVQDNVELTGPTEHHQRPPYKAHAEKLPLGLQDHGNPVRYRNIWIRELK